MKVALLFLACLLAANAAVLPQKGLSVTEGEIDTLIKDAAVAYRSWIKKLEPLNVGTVAIPIKIEGLNVKTTDTKLWIGETLKYSESSSLSNDELGISVEIVQKGAGAEGTLQVTGTSQGKQVDQQGKIEIIVNTVGKKTTLKAQLTPNSVNLVDVDSVPEMGDISISIKGIKIDGVSESDLETAIAEGIKALLIESEEKAKKLLPIAIEQINHIIGKLSLQEIYDFLRKKVPSS